MKSFSSSSSTSTIYVRLLFPHVGAQWRKDAAGSCSSRTLEALETRDPSPPPTSSVRYNLHRELRVWAVNQWQKWRGGGREVQWLTCRRTHLNIINQRIKRLIRWRRRIRRWRILIKLLKAFTASSHSPLLLSEGNWSRSLNLISASFHFVFTSHHTGRPSLCLILITVKSYYKFTVAGQYFIIIVPHS